MYQPVVEGGINFVNFYMVVKSLSLAWIGRLLGKSDDKWKVIQKYIDNTFKRTNCFS